MKRIISLVLFICYFKYEVNSLKLPGPRVYVVTPSPKTPHNDQGRPKPFYYRNWMKRMDAPWNTTSTTTTTTQKTKTPDLIFAEFESGSDNVKSIRKLLEKEKLDTTSTTSTTLRPIYVPDEESDNSEVNYGLPITTTTTTKPKQVDMTDYFALYNNLYNTGPLLSPVYVPPTIDSTSSTSAPSFATPPAISTTVQTPTSNVENIWHIIDSEKNDHNSEKWEEEPLSPEHSTTFETKTKDDEVTTNNDNNGDDNKGDDVVDENFAIPGFGTPGNGGENESRAIRTEPNFRFPYVSLKPFQMKTQNEPLFNSFSTGSKKQNTLTSLDHFYDVKNPVRGEAQDVALPVRQPIDRYNPAQPYLPQQSYGPAKSKQSVPSNSPAAPPPAPPSSPVRAVASLVPPPPPPAPKVNANDFPTPSTYESFPPYAPAAPAPSSASSPDAMLQPPTDLSGPDSSDDLTSFDDSDGPPMGLGYRYKPPSPPVAQFFPTLPPTTKPFSGYSYDKPPMPDISPPSTMGMGNKPEYHGYHYSKPEPSAPPQDHPAPSYEPQNAPPPSYEPDTDYPDLIFHKPHNGLDDMKAGNDMKDIGMKPPPQSPTVHSMKPDMDPHGAPDDDSGFPHDFPEDFKYHHDFDDHDYHHHHYHTTTTTTTTEMPRVNRYSYYYLGKKLYYLPLYFSVYFIIYVGALIIKAVLRHKITYPNSWRPNDQTASFFSKRSIESHLSNENLHEITGRVTRAIATAAEKYVQEKNK